MSLEGTPVEGPGAVVGFAGPRAAGEAPLEATSEA
jgi:hypothetical protein